MKQRNEKLKLIGLMAAYHEANLSAARAEIYLQDIGQWELSDLEAAWKKYRMNVSNGNRMPTPAQLIALIDDGRPSAQTSWALIGKSEDDSFVWTDEMREAWSYAWPHVRNGDTQTAWFTYKENYERIVAEKRQAQEPVKWTPSFGFNKSGREDAIIKAVQENKITLEAAAKYCPEIEHNPKYEFLLNHEQKKQLAHNSDGQNKIRELIATIGTKGI